LSILKDPFPDLRETAFVLRKTFHVVLACLIAAPLGAGGLCCCLLGGDAHEAGGMAMAAAGPGGDSCCASEAGPSAPAPRRHDSGDDPDGDCACPVREVVVFAQAAPGSELAGPAPSVDLLGVPQAAPTVLEAPASDATSRHPDPPPKIPLFRTLSVLRC